MPGSETQVRNLAEAWEVPFEGEIEAPGRDHT